METVMGVGSAKANQRKCTTTTFSQVSKHDRRKSSSFEFMPYLIYDAAFEAQTAKETPRSGRKSPKLKKQNLKLEESDLRYLKKQKIGRLNSLMN